MEREAFLEQMMRPEAGDEMAFRVEREDPSEGFTFSQEAVDATAENMKLFVMARTFARWQATGQAPQSMTVTLNVKWDDDSDLGLGGPWWELQDHQTTPLDGAHRVEAVVKGGRR
jgi:hypothetical protein